MYLLDANVFIQAKNLHYRFPTFPCFWSWLDECNTNGQLASINFIKQELANGNDTLASWAKAASSNWFLQESDIQTQQNFSSIAHWVITHQQFHQTAKNEFLSCGDPWLIAKAKSINATIVTHEKSVPQSKKKIFIPDVCIQYGVQYIDTFDLLETLNAQF
ncbi:DUF4411 family protein [Halodesulfovibrio aestuarii]|uniref:DUF4411 family protein n=1 Tax=Halodesulfovibrio aestuarii TaxID=126333 RepID=A0A8G2C983_9BACT|nr:DUF4411 family protein [Halodesulfovibrio aestuarii]SHJ05335.1 protein of unknown function [Halodesulfovibrio aestuarii]